VWTPNTSASSVTELTSTGTPVSGSPYTGGGLDKPYAIAIDSSGSAWVTSYTDNKLTKLSSSGSILMGPATRGFRELRAPTPAAVTCWDCRTPEIRRRTSPRTQEEVWQWMAPETFGIYTRAAYWSMWGRVRRL
jgi:hypothetical protein